MAAGPVAFGSAAWLEARQGLVSWALFGLGLALGFTRNPSLFLHPFAGWEDATQGFNFYVRDGAPVFHWYAGYVSAAPNIVDWVLLTWLRLPLVWVAYAFAWCALAVAALVAPAIFCALRRGARLAVAPALVMAALLACMPFGDLASNSNTEFAIWNMLPVLLLTQFNTVPRGLGGRMWFVGWRALFAASIPLSAALLPGWLALGAMAARRRVFGDAAVYGVLALLGAGYLAFWVQHTAGGRLTAGALPVVAAATIRLAVEKSLFFVVLRSVLGINLHDVPVAAQAVIGLATAGGLGWLHARGRADPRRAWLEIGVLMVGIVSVSLLCMLGRGLEHGIEFLMISPRYHYVQKLAWALALGLGLLDVWRLAPRTGWQRQLVLGVAVTATGLIWAKDIKTYRHHDATDSDRVLRFLAQAQAGFDAGKPGPFQLTRTDPSGDWSFDLRRR